MPNVRKKTSDESSETSRDHTRTAVVIVHGMGNQRPLETTRGLIDALYGAHDQKTDLVVKKSGDTERPLWFALDRTISDTDLPVVTTGEVLTADGSHRNIDFHEFYWAPAMSEVRFVAVPLWLFALIRKGPSRMLPGVRPLWFLIGILLAFWIWSATLLAISGGNIVLGLTSFAQDWQNALAPFMLAALAVYSQMKFRGVLLLLGAALGLAIFWLLLLGLHYAFTGGYLNWIALKACFGFLSSPPNIPMALGSRSALIVAVWGLVVFVVLNTFFLLTVAGDAARYLRTAPENIAVRREIRSQGANLLKRLHGARVWNPQSKAYKFKYDRIIVVAHSLGTIVAYDVLRTYWSLVSHGLGDPRSTAEGQEQDEYLNSPVNDDPGWRTHWRNNCRTLVREVDARAHIRRGETGRWVITDLVTLGSPLSQAQFLLADGETAASLDVNFQIKKSQREFPTAPAIKQTPDGALSLPLGHRHLFHGAALFGLTRWTNLYFPVKWVMWGDLVGGKLASTPLGKDKILFGEAIMDVEVDGAPSRNLFAHTAYWTVPKHRSFPLYLTELRTAVNIADREEG
jgi:hypothetical protein